MKKLMLFLFLATSFSVLFAQDAREIKLNLKVVGKRNENFGFAKFFFVDKQNGDTLKTRLNVEGEVSFYTEKTDQIQFYVEGKPFVLNLDAESQQLDVISKKLTVGKSVPLPFEGEDTTYQALDPRQKSTRNCQLLKFQVVNPSNATLPNVTVELFNQQNKKRYISASDESGFLRFLVPEGDYQLIPEGNVDYPVLKVRRKTGMVTTEFLTLRTTPIIETTANDTTTQTFPVRIVPTYSRIQLSIRIADKKDQFFANEEVYVNVDSTSKVYKGVTDLTGVVHFLLPKGHIYYVHTATERNIEAIEIQKTSEKLWIELNYSYFAAEMMRRQADMRSKSHVTSFAVFDDKRPTMDDSVVFTVLNKMKDIQKKLIVTDLTGSMYPYGSQLLAWYKLNYRKDSKADLIFFNDGDKKPDDKKKIGSTGGIYSCYQCSYDSCLASMLTTVGGGYGGDTPENNLEALLYAIKNVKTYDALIMIADNYATPRDMELLRKVKVPVKIIVCGAIEGSINTAYLKIARETKGAVYTMENELTNLAHLHEGELLEIGNKVYKIKNGDFVFLKNRIPKHHLR